MTKILAAMVILIACSTSAVADPATAAAKAHYEKGTTLYDLGKYTEAAHEYEEAYAAKNDPALLFNVAQAYRLSGDAASALRTYRSYLRRVPNAPNRAEVERHIASLQQLVDEQKRSATSPPTDTMQPGTLPSTHPMTSTSPGGAAEPQPATTGPTTSAPAEALVSSAPPPEKKTPLYKKWWLWTAVAAVAVVGVGVGVGVAETTPHNAPAPAGTLPVSFP
jgi:tetratricopeptide (TPR) repeat protein